MIHPLSRWRPQPAPVQELDEVALALLVRPQPGQIGGELGRRAQPLMTFPDLDEQVGDLLVDRIAGLRHERFDRAQIDGQGVARPVLGDQVGEGEPLPGAGDSGRRRSAR